MKSHLGVGQDGLERELRGVAPQAGDAFVAGLAAAIPVRRRPRSRMSFAAGVAVLVLGTFASFGGVAVAANGAASAAKAAKAAVTAADDQYGEEVEVEVPVETTPAVTETAPTVEVKSSTAKSSPPSKGTLPFTGLSLAGTVVLGGALLTLGFALRRRESRA
jgi:hypothetical protein